MLSLILRNKVSEKLSLSLLNCKRVVTCMSSHNTTELHCMAKGKFVENGGLLV